MSIGDYAEMPRAQSLAQHAGKIVRLRHDGRLPSDNPFVGRSGALPAIWALGVRNPQGMALDPLTGRLWTCEHGPMGGDELNLIERGHNYGWPVITHGRNYDGSRIGAGISAKPGLEQPVRQWTPSIAPSGLSFYNGNLFPAWRGHIFMGALKYRIIVRMRLGGGDRRSGTRNACWKGASAAFGRSALDRTAGSTCSPTKPMAVSGPSSGRDRSARITQSGQLRLHFLMDIRLGRVDTSVKPCPASARRAASATFLRHYTEKLLTRRDRAAPDAGQGSPAAVQRQDCGP